MVTRSKQNSSEPLTPEDLTVLRHIHTLFEMFDKAIQHALLSHTSLRPVTQVQDIPAVATTQAAPAPRTTARHNPPRTIVPARKRVRVPSSRTLVYWPLDAGRTPRHLSLTEQAVWKAMTEVPDLHQTVAAISARCGHSLESVRAILNKFVFVRRLAKRDLESADK